MPLYLRYSSACPCNLASLLSRSVSVPAVNHRCLALCCPEVLSVPAVSHGRLALCTTGSTYWAAVIIAVRMDTHESSTSCGKVPRTSNDFDTSNCHIFTVETNTQFFEMCYINLYQIIQHTQTIIQTIALKNRLIIQYHNNTSLKVASTSSISALANCILMSSDLGKAANLETFQVS